MVKSQKIDWLPTEKICKCDIGRLNCLDRKETYKLGSTVLNIQARQRWDEKHPARFIPELPERYIKLFSHLGETVLDPFCGSGTTNVEAKKIGRNSIGIDVNPYSTDMTVNRLKKTKSNNGWSETKHMIINDDTRNICQYVPKDSLDLIITSPPYFDVVDYNNDNPNQFGNMHQYNDFLECMEKSFKSLYCILKPNRYMIINTQDLFKKAAKCSIHSDYIQICRKIGFELINLNIYILNYSNGGRLVFGYPKAYYPKNDHEFNLIFQKV